MIAQNGLKEASGRRVEGGENRRPDGSSKVRLVP